MINIAYFFQVPMLSSYALGQYKLIPYHRLRNHIKDQWWELTNSKVERRYIVGQPQKMIIDMKECSQN